MAEENPFSVFADPNSFWNQPIIPKFGGFLSNLYENIGQSESELRSGIGAASSRAISGLGRFGTTVGNALTFPITAARETVSGQPLTRGGATFGRVRKSEQPTPTVPTLPSGTPMVGFDIYPTTKQSVVPPIDASKNFVGQDPRPATKDDLDYFYGRGKYATTPTPQPVFIKPSSPYSNKVPIQTPYGMVYASNQTPEGGGSSQAMSDRVTEMAGLPAQSARLEKIGEEARRSARIEGMRQQGARTARDQRLETEEFFNVAQNKRAEEREKKIQKAKANQSSETKSTVSAGGQKRQRSWSNYTGPDPLSGFKYEDEATAEKARRKRRRA
jgi:hypothetical protein